MKTLRRTTAAVVTGLGVLAFLAAPSFAGGNHGAGGAGPTQFPHMGQGQAGGCGGPMDMMGSGMMGLGMMGPGYGMVPGSAGRSMASPCPHGAAQDVDKDLSADDVRSMLEQSMKLHVNTLLKVGEVTETDDGTIIAEIVTVDDSLVQRMEIDRHSGSIRSIQ